MVNFERKETYSLQDLIEILRILRAPGGCPWDRAQTHLSDRRNFLEEAYEAAEAFDRDDPALMCEELGDMLMQVLFNIHIEEDAGRFTTDDVTDHICKKLIFRHPHVFGTAAADTSEEVLVNWEALKRQEKGQQTTADAMDAVARSLPALWRADKLQSKAAKAGFEFADVSGALDKLDEETRELREAVERGTNFSEELGDVLFAAVKAGRFLNVDPEDALNATCEKFIARFRRVEEACAARLIALGQPPETAKKKARMAEGCVGRALAIDDGQLELRMALTRDVFSVHRPADVPGVVNLYKEDKERQKLVLDTLEIALRDILVQQAGGASVAGAGYAREAEDYARRTPLSGGLSLMETLRRARVMLAGNVAFASAFETILLQISEEYAKWPW